MTRKILWKLRQFARRLWVRATLVSCLALIAALSAPLSNYLPLSVATKIDRDTLSGLLQILTNSMLTVTTFSLSIMVTAHLAADSSATPRAHRLLQQDSRTQTVLATFIGAFVYALTLTIMLNLGLLAEDELAIVYFFTVAVILLVVIAILRWVGHLDGLGSVEATIRRAEERAAAEISRRNLIPYLGGRPRDAVAVPAKARRLEAASSGYLQDIDVRSLSEAVGPESRVWVEVAPGDWIVEGGLLAHVEATEWSEATIGALRAGFTFNDRREHGQDTTYSLIVMTEIGERALSPGINDPRTGLDVIGRITRMILRIEPETPLDSPHVENVFVPAADRGEMLRSALDPIARDGRTFREIGMAIQAAASALSRHPDPAIERAGRVLSARGLSYARDGLLLIEDMDRLGAVAVADGPARMVGDDPARSVAAALGEEQKASHFRERR